MQKTIKRVIKAQNIMMGPIEIRQALPIGQFDQIDPFLLLHHFGPREQEPGGRNILDIGPHPHRGFETITFVFEGEIHHKDSRDNDKTIGAGGVQWMTAARGIVHSESPSRQFIEQGGKLEIIQLWVNLPSHLKMNQPAYYGLSKEDIPTINENGFSIQVVSGTYNKEIGAIAPLSETDTYIVNHQDSGSISFNIPEDKNILFYQLDGRCKINGIESGEHKMFVFNNDGDTLEIEALGKGKFILLSAIPLDEEIARHGPFVMNNQTEILRAMRDYQMGKMGILI